ncbi:uncharacterized protein PHALS_10616 [Plasmopara halstedii]|uniref:RxLR-like protein n=1 Tax=Plasmopara halstedii TaxID=4781 RepID=A0A0P1AI86_PLAHL|nr:uncharacterized protein PHALS_10616 [Plasmopara halstedii]CEG40415.1 hypothetical protein PHALS_10616 [Plasmopara halstedii]|eukprot:XP_024576784.1 hypothetical protein PHALS_10616 [Plasmopara halstedii]
MFVLILSTLFLLDVSVSSTSNSSTLQHEVPIVFVGHLNDSLPSANSSSTVAKEELESYDDSEQDITEIDETDVETRMFLFSGKMFLSHFHTKSPLNEANIKPLLTTFADARALLEIKKRDSAQNKNLFSHLTTLLGSNDEQMKLFAGVTVSKLLTDPVTREVTQQQFLDSVTKLSTIFTVLMINTKFGSLNEFFELGLHIPLLSYACKLLKADGILGSFSRVVEDEVKVEVIRDAVRLLTETRKGGNLITWLGTYETKLVRPMRSLIEDYFYSLVDGLLRRTKVLAYRLHSLRYPDLVSFHEHYSSLYDDICFDHWLDFAAFTRFNYIEHEAKSSDFIYPQVLKLMKQQGSRYTDDDTILSYFDPKNLLTRTALMSNQFFDWSQLNNDQFRLFRAALQTEDQTNLVRKTLEEMEYASAFMRNLGSERMVEKFEALLNDKDLIEPFQKVLEDEYLVQLLRASLENNQPVDISSGLTMGTEKLNQIEDDVMKTFQMLVTDNEKLQMIGASLVDDVNNKLYGNAFEAAKHLKSVEDMLSSTELDTMNLLEAILKNQETVQLLKVVLRDDKHLNLFRSVLEDNTKSSEIELALSDENLANALNDVLMDVGQVFFLRVAIKDDDRAKLCRAALEKKAQVKVFEEALNKKKLNNVLRSILKDEERLHLLKKAVRSSITGSFETLWL